MPPNPTPKHNWRGKPIHTWQSAPDLWHAALTWETDDGWRTITDYCTTERSAVESLCKLLDALCVPVPTPKHDAPSVRVVSTREMLAAFNAAVAKMMNDPDIFCTTPDLPRAETAHRAMAAVRDLFGDARRSITSLRADLDKLRAKNDRLTKERDEAIAARKKLWDENRWLESRRDEALESNTKLRGERERLTQDLSRLRARPGVVREVTNAQIDRITSQVIMSPTESDFEDMRHLARAVLALAEPDGVRWSKRGRVHRSGQPGRENFISLHGPEADELHDPQVDNLERGQEYTVYFLAVPDAPRTVTLDGGNYTAAELEEMAGKLREERS